MEQVLKGDFSKFEAIGKQMFGGAATGEEVLGKLLNMIPEGDYGRKLNPEEENNETQTQ